MPFTERRKYRRFPVRLPVSFSLGQAEGGGQLIDISMGGCRVESQIGAEEGGFVKLKVVLPDQGDTDPMEVDLAPVRWSRGGQFGMEFVDMSERAKQRLYKFVTSLKGGATPPRT